MAEKEAYYKCQLQMGNTEPNYTGQSAERGVKKGRK